jgi:hypothetical protein
MVSGSAHALEPDDSELVGSGDWLCDPDRVASGDAIECERPSPPELPELPADSEEAPMCDETGASIAALLPVPELDRGRFEVLPCESVLALFGGKTLDFPGVPARLSDHKPPAPELVLALSRADATAVSALALPERDEAQLLPAALGAGLGASPGHLRLPYRPPLRRS